MIAQLDGDPREVQQRQQDLGDLLIQSAALADMVGRRRLWLEFDQRVRSRPEDRLRGFAGLGLTHYAEIEAGATPVAKVPFDEAIADLLQRDPRLAIGWQEVQRVYTRERGFSLAKAATQVLVDRIQLQLAQAIQSGRSPTAVQEEIRQEAQANTLPFTRGYTETVYRTNMNSAFTAGRMRQARAPEVRAVTPGFRYDAINDGAVRPNHQALDGVVALQNDPIWQSCSPPLGYNCRCTLALATAAELRQAGVVRDGRAFSVTKPAGAGPDPGFAKVNRTDAEVYPPGPPLPLV